MTQIKRAPATARLEHDDDSQAKRVLLYGMDGVTPTRVAVDADGKMKISGGSGGSSAWGGITGTLSDQTDLNSALGGKAATSHTHTASEITDFDTEVSNNTDVAANTSHRSSTSNPHSVTLPQAGLAANGANIKFGTFNCGTGTNKTLTFTTAFSTACSAVIVSVLDSAGANARIIVRSWTASAFVYDVSGGAATTNIVWMAIGS